MHNLLQVIQSGKFANSTFYKAFLVEGATPADSCVLVLAADLIMKFSFESKKLEWTIAMDQVLRQ